MMKQKRMLPTQNLRPSGDKESPHLGVEITDLKTKRMTTKRLSKFLVVMLLPMALCFLSIGAHAQTTITGKTFNDGNNNGILDTTEVGYPYVVVNAYAPGATVPTATAITLGTPAASVGDYTLSGLTTGINYRIEFINPTNYFNGAFGTGSKSSVQFATPGTINLNFGFRVPGICIAESNPRIVAGLSDSQSIASWKLNNNTIFNNAIAASTSGLIDPHQKDISRRNVGVPYQFGKDGLNNLLYFHPCNSVVKFNSTSDSTYYRPDGRNQIYYGA